MGASKWSKEKLQRYLNEGRGQGTGEEYLPWLKTYEFSSQGRSTRIYGLKTKRTHHLHSDNQYRAFLLFEFNSTVIDIRESFPLLDVMEVINDKGNLRFDKFTDKETMEPYILTTNFLLTMKDTNGDVMEIARTVKNTTELKRKITFEKLEIERRYWQERGVNWKVITEKQLPRQLAKNIEWIRETMLDSSDGNLDKDSLSLELYRFLIENDELPVKDALKQFDKRLTLNKGSALFLFRYLLAKKEITIDLVSKIDLSNSFRTMLLR